jgi:DNA-binding transcriptional LysR family regulator
MEAEMELRHLRYFIAVAEEGSLTLAAEKRLHTAQPSLSRQIRDLECEVGVQLMIRSVHGIELTRSVGPFSTMHGWHLIRRRQLLRRRGDRRNRRGHRLRSASSPAMRWIGYRP